MTDTLRGHERQCRHEAALYASADEYLAVAVPFIQAGVDAAEPVLVVAQQANETLLRAEFEHEPAVSVLDGVAEYSQPTSAIRTLRAAGASHFRNGARRVRIIGEIAQPVVGRPWQWWARFESAVDSAFDEFPLDVMCTYDLRTTGADELTDVLHTHRYLSRPDALHQDNPEHLGAERFAASRRPEHGAEPLETQPPTLELVDPSAADARGATRTAGHGTRLDEEAVDDYVTAVSEAVTNAVRHGRPAVRLRQWSAADRLVTTVTDRGDGPSDPLAGLLAPASSVSGATGLWLAHQMCSHVTLGRDADGFTIRLVAGLPARAN